MANSPDSGSLDQGAEELFMPGWLLSGEPDTHTGQPDTFLGELELDQPVVRLVARSQRWRRWARPQTCGVVDDPQDLGTAEMGDLHGSHAGEVRTWLGDAAGDSGCCVRLQRC